MRIENMKLRNCKGQARRIFFNYLRTEYVDEQLGKRKGDCRQCGKCCALVFRCPFLNSESKCIIYHKGRPRHCTTFPLDNNDLQDIDGECGYSFD